MGQTPHLVESVQDFVHTEPWYIKHVLYSQCRDVCNNGLLLHTAKIWPEPRNPGGIICGISPFYKRHDITSNSGFSAVSSIPQITPNPRV